MFLEGYLKEENIRFRDHKIKFERINTDSKTAPVKLISWKKMEKKLFCEVECRYY